MPRERWVLTRGRVERRDTVLSRDLYFSARGTATLTHEEHAQSIVPWQVRR